MKQWVADEEIQLTRSLGQNFLHDSNQLRKIVGAAELQPTESVLEIGPGLGPLTELLASRARQLLAIEKDLRLVQILRKRFGTAIELLHDDALEYLRRLPRDWSQWKLVANLPYSVASPILVELAWAPQCPSRMVVTLQLEVARRLMAAPKNPDYGLLTLLIQLRYQPGDWFKIPASCFFPEPDVDSACVVLSRREERLLAPESEAAFRQIVKRAFSQRRKMMFKLLKEDWPAARLEPAFTQTAIDPRARAETVSLEQFVRLTRILSAHSAHG
jgi:16S rRNA (adenine1518-N6/adenine1519-N6)-dimethyltransferase